MITISVDEIQGDLTGYLQRVPTGETVLITQLGQPIAEIKRVTPTEENSASTLRPSGLAEGEFVVPDDFDAPLPEDILRAIEGR